jgi:hypothetical protein
MLNSADWAKIKARYISGETPFSISKDYDSLTPKAISNKAFKNKWGSKKESVGVILEKKIVTEHLDQLTQWVDKAVAVNLVLVDLMAEKLKDPLVAEAFLTEKVGNACIASLNNATKLLVQRMQTKVDDSVAAPKSTKYLGIEDDGI